MEKIWNLIIVTLLIISVLSTFFVGMGEAESNPELQSNGATEISDWTDLNDIRNDLTGDYVLVSDLNENTAGYDTYVDTADGWDSIGGLNDGFKGSLNGQGFTINDLLIDRPDSNYQALFSFSSGDISNVSLENVNITGQALVGGLVAENSGTVSNSYVTGEINSTTGDTSPSNAGGLVGYNYNVIEDSYSNGYVNGSTSVGGLVGKNEGNIDDSYSTSNVNGDPYNCGGLVGSNEGYINNTYATGDVTVSGDHSQGDAGGLVGSNGGGYVNNSYATGNVVSPGSNIGGLVGNNGAASSLGTVTDSFSLFSASYDVIGYAAEGTELGRVMEATDTELKDIRLYTDDSFEGYDNLYSAWNIETEINWDGQTWIIDDGNAYPTFYEQTYEISDWEDLHNVRHDLDGSYTLVNNIDENSAGYDDYASSNAHSGNGWMPIGNLIDSGFNGDFDGNSNTIADLFIDRAGEKSIGLFGSTDFDTRISNLSLTNVDITGDRYVGSLTGSTYGYIENCSADGNLVGTEGTWTPENIGGLVGRAIAGEITESYANVDVTGTPSAGVGGFVGGISSSTVRNCYALGDVEGDTNVGGFVGENNDKIYTSYSNGSVSGNSEVGGFVGNDSSGDGSTFDSYWDTETSGLGTSEGGTGLTTSEMKGDAAITNMAGFDFDNTWDVVAGSEISYPYLQSNTQDPAPGLNDTFYAGGDGSTSDPYQISNWYHLDNVRDNLGANYTLVDNLDETTDGYDEVASENAIANTTEQLGHYYGDDSGTTFELQTSPIEEVIYVKDTDDGSEISYDADLTEGTVTIQEDTGDTTEIKYRAEDLGWKPIGDFSTFSTIFTGTFDGQENQIRDLYINRSNEDYIALFGASEGTVENIGVVGADVSGSSNVGVLVGRNEDTVNNSYANGNVIGDSNVGGLVGYNLEGTVNNSYATGDVSGTEDVGGLVGYSDGATVNNSYATGDVSGNDHVGGLVGEIYEYEATVENSYATGDVSGDSSVGGLVGEKNKATVKNSYATGKVSGNDYVGGLIGYNLEDTVTDSYWDVNTTGQNTSAGLPDENGLTTDEMKGASATENMTGFDFTNTWDIVASELTISYPYLQNNTQSPAPGEERLLYAGGDGSEESPYEIENWHHLNNTRDYLDDNFTLVDNLDETTNGYDEVASSTANSGKGFEPIGDSSAPFTGTFNGSGYTISNLTINRSTTNDVGLFGAIGSGAVVERVGLEDANITGNSDVGGLVGENYGEVTESYSTGTVNGSGNNVGGLVGYNEGPVNSSYATGTVDGGSYVGGLTGYNWENNVVNSYAIGDVNGAEYIGGLVGENWDGTVDSSHARGNASGDTYVGGLVGYSTGTVVSSNATGNVAGTDSIVGGLIGWNKEGTIDSSNASGNVSSVGEVGGLIGENDNGVVNSSYATGNVSGDWQIGGLVGWNRGGSVNTSYATGTVLGNGSNEIGGLIGWNDGGSVNTSYATGDVIGDGDNLVGGLVGQNDEGTIDSSYAIGDVNGTENIGGLVGDNSGGTVNSSYATGNITGYALVGGLVGDSSGTVVSSNATGNVTGADVDVGGLVGWNDGTVDSSYASGTVTGAGEVGGLVGNNNGGSVSSSNATGDVTGTGEGYGGAYWVGGLLGSSSGPVNTSYATGSVTGEGSSSGIGGLVGENNNELNTSYALGNVTGDARVGGLIGNNDDGSVNATYATGYVSGNSEVGGLTGANSGTVTDSYWDTETTGQSDSAGGTGLTTLQMRGDAAIKNMDGFDFNNVWTVLNETNNDKISYPYLVNNPQTPKPGAESTGEAQYITVTPDSSTIYAGDSQSFFAVAVDEDGTEWNITEKATWSDNVTEGNSSWDGNTITVYESGVWTVTAEYENETTTLTDESTLNVDPASADYIVISPEESTITAGESENYTATAFDEYDNEIGDVTAETGWSIDGDAGGYWHHNSNYTSKKAGNWTVTGEYGEFTNTSILNVDHSDAVDVSIEPTETTIKAAESETYTAIAVDEFENEFDVSDQTIWSDDVTPESESYWVNNETTVNVTGTWTITAEYENETGTTLSDTSVLNVEAEDVKLEPENEQIVDVGDELQFSAYAYDVNGNLLTDDAEDFEWENTSDTGLFKESEIGEYNVSATYEGASNSTSVYLGGFEIRDIQIDDNKTWTGDKIYGNYTVKNTAAETAYTCDIMLLVDGEPERVIASPSLNPGQTWHSADNDGGFEFSPSEIKEYNLSVAVRYNETIIHANTTQVEGVGYAVDIAEITPETILYDDTVTVTANITNENPDDTKQQTIDFYVDDIWKDSTDVTITSGDTEQVEFTWTAEEQTDYTFKVESEDDSDTEEVKVEEVVDISLTPAEQDITVGESVPYYAWAINKSGEEVKNVTSEASFQTVDHDHSAYWNDNVYTPEDAGNFTIEATWSNYDSHRNTTWVNVATGTVSYVEIDPAANQTLKAGEELVFSAAAYDEYDNLIDDNDGNFTWEVTIISGESASIDDWGNFSTTEPGDYEVTAEYDGVTSPVTNVTVEPAEVSRVVIETEDESQDDQTAEPDEEVNFTAEARDEYNNLITDNVSQFEWTNIWEVNETRNVAVFNESEIGTYNVTATYNGETSNVISVNIGPYLDITGGESEIDAGEWSNYTAELYDETGEFVEEVTGSENTTWEIVEDGHNGTWYDYGNYTSYTAGKWTVKAVYVYSDDLTLNDTVTLKVKPGDVVEVTIDPSKDFSIEAGTEENFTAEAYDEYDNLITDVGNEFSWKNTDDWGLFKETVTDEYEVTATYPKVNGGVTSPTITVKVRASTINLSQPVIIEPKVHVIGKFGSIEYTVNAYDIYNNEFDAEDRFDWYVETGAGGSWESSKYLPQNTGSWYVYAQYEGEAGIYEDGEISISEEIYTERLNLMVSEDDFAGGSGTADDPYQIDTVWQLQNAGKTEYLDAHFILTSDIDASYTETWNNGKGFKPIGTREDRFTGTFNGDGYEVQGLYIDRTGENEVGLFGFTGDEAVIKNVGVTNAEVHGWTDTGGLVGYNRGTIQKSYATGTVTGYYNIGVLAGRNWKGTIEESYSTGTAEGEIRRVGGLVGFNCYSTITDTYSTADVTGTATDSYKIGGLVGRSSDSTISYSYAIGSVSGGENLGALVGENTAGATIEESYANNETTGQESLVGLNDAEIDANSTAMNTTDMTEYEDEEYVNAFFEWDFDTVWTAQAVDDAYPGLQQEVNTESVNSESDRSLEGLTGYLLLLVIIAMLMLVAAIYYKKEN